MPYLNETDKLKGDVQELKSSPSGKGWILVCDGFDCFLWSTDKRLKHLLTAIAVWIDGGVGCQLQVTRRSVDDKGFEIGKKMKGKDSIPVVWRHTQHGYTCREMEVETDTNPFLI
jgi:hypothetical protein